MKKHFSYFITVSFPLVIMLHALAPLLAVGQSHKTTQPETRTISFTTNEGTRLAFDISPDGRWIVFDLLGQLWRIPAEGGEAVPLTDAVKDHAEDLDPSFSPDGQWISFQSDRPEGRGVFLMPASGGEARLLTDRYVEYFAYATPDWSPDGEQIAYSLGDIVAVIDIESGREMELEIDSLPPANPGPPWIPRNGSPAWSPDGNHISFVNNHGDGRIWQVETAGGAAHPLTPEGFSASAPAYSPDGLQLAFIAQDEEMGAAIWVQEIEDGHPRLLIAHEEVVPTRVRWSPDGDWLWYSADGGIWRVPVVGGDAERIPFSVHVEFQRRQPTPAFVTFDAPDSKQAARGFYSLAFSPDARRIAMTALDRLWVFDVGGKPIPVNGVPGTASAIEWSPNGRFLAWIDATSRDLYITDLEEMDTQRMTELPGGIQWPRWSPDGKHLAFVHRNELWLAVPGKDMIRESGDAHNLGAISTYVPNIAWVPEGNALIVSDSPQNIEYTAPAEAQWISLEGERRTIEHFPRAPTYFHIHNAGRATYIEGNSLWRVDFLLDTGMVDEPNLLVEEPALLASHASDGSVLYVSTDGLRIRRTDGALEKLGWPLAYRTPAAGSLLIRNARVIDGRGGSPHAEMDIRVENGKIVALEPFGQLEQLEGEEVVDADGRTVIPGLIDLHTHTVAGQLLAGYLYHGITTIRDVGTSLIHSAAARDAVAGGVQPGPRMVIGGMVFAFGPGYTNANWNLTTDPEALSRGVQLARAFGADYIKERSFARWFATTHLVEEANRHGMTISGHCGHILPVVAAGVTGREHTRDCYRDWLVVRNDILQLTRAADLWAVPTLSDMVPFLRVGQDSLLVDKPEISAFLPADSPYRLAVIRQPPQQQFFQGANERRRSTTERYIQAGIPLVTGSDNIFPLSVHYELEELVAIGMTPLEAIVTATGLAASALNTEEIGTVEVGKWADLILLDANPLEDIRNTRKIWKVIKGGEIVDRNGMLKWANEMQDINQISEQEE